ncbi:MAG: FAD-binding oxidoreductase [Bifidobacteriaceae bacterium]|jgi:glycine/D-amino acid oxidase-like deaminating enzyme|nr:FAD-binding oxidoreductase [Bifidobacteriaceae bacterium]
MTTTADIIVIGAGIVGSSAAFQLAKSGRDVLVVDKAAGPGFGSTSSSSAVVRFEYSKLETAVSAWESRFIWQNLRDYLAAPASEPVAAFHQIGLVILDSASFTHAYLSELFQTLGAEWVEYDAPALAAAYPGIETGSFHPPKRVDSEEFWADPVGQLGAVVTPQAGFVDDPRLAAENFAKAAGRFGARALYGARVTGIVRDQGIWRVTLADGSVAEAPELLNAAGPWSGDIQRLAGVGGEFAISTRPMRQEVHSVASPPGYNPPGGLGPAVVDEDLGYYLRPEPSGSLIVGGAEPECDGMEWVEGPVDQVDLNRTQEKFDAQVTRAARRFPDLSIPPRPSGVAGVYDVADDWTPIIDKTDAPGYFVGIGTSGNCFKHGPVFGEFLDAIVTASEEGRDHDADPVTWTGPQSGLTVNLGFFSRLREPLATSGGVSG